MDEGFYEEYFRIEDRHWWFVGRRRIILSVLAQQTLSRPDGAEPEILDLGCGTGTMLGHLRAFGTVRGIDADERAVAFCRARGEERVELLESNRLPLPDDSLDLVTALDVLEHIEDDRAAFAEIARVLRPGGTLLATVPASRWMWGPSAVSSSTASMTRDTCFGRPTHTPGPDMSLSFPRGCVGAATT